jgi:hypothetical protein
MVLVDNNNAGNACPYDYTVLHGHGQLTEDERKMLEQKLSRLLEWVGIWVPDDIVIDGQKVPLHETIWKLIKKDHLSHEEEALLLNLEDRLDKKYKEDLGKIMVSDRTEDQAFRDYCEAAGLLRAIATLKDIEKREEKAMKPDELIDAMNRAKKARAREWLEYLRQLSAI